MVKRLFDVIEADFIGGIDNKMNLSQLAENRAAYCRRAFSAHRAPAAGAAWRPPGRYSGRVVASAGFGAVFRVFESARD